MQKLSRIKKIGLSLGPRETYLIEIAHLLDRFEVTNLVDIDLESPFNFDTIDDKKSLENIGNNLKEAVLSEKITANDILISLDYRMAMIRRLPVDNNLNDNEINKHVLWELKQHLISPVEEYNIDFQKLPKTSFYNYPSLLIVSVKKKIVDAVRYISKISNLNLKLIDINIFASINALETNYKVKSTEKIAAIEIAKNQLIFIMLEGINFLGFHSINLNETQYQDKNVPSEKISDEITKNLRFFISDYETGKDKAEFDRVFLFKNNKDLNLNEILEIVGESKFEILNPLKRLSISSEIKEKMDPLSDYSEFTESVGLAIRK
ncbi:MAG: pilus assembly protein PilM [Candidatus Helarchaeota archaeon]|nr:pilus assembly protein PilM [Candidatus Helarchaeota archaeon]